ncbi:hypothetical protein ACVRZD_10055 [Streptococcus hongkongensis]|nr:hypothetical protein NC01_09145 [Streptococcus uberis]
MSVPVYKKAVLNYDFVGPNNRSNYFEGWYLKCATEDKTIALIPSLHIEKGLMTGHLQWIVSQGDRIFSGNQSYSIEETILSSSPFYLRLGDNSFTETGFKVKVEDLTISAQFQEIIPYPKNIMGPFRIFKNLPCIHGLQAINGRVDFTTENPYFSGNFTSSFYCEKDRGTTFPERYIWLHSDFPEEKASLFFSIALIPLGPIKFDGYIANLNIDGTNETFTTYDFSRVIVSQNTKGQELILLSNSKKAVEILLKKGKVEALNSPREGSMVDSVEESMDSVIEVTVTDKRTGHVRILRSNRCSYEVSGWFSS